MRLVLYRFAGFMAIFIGLSIVVNIIDLDLGYHLLGPIFLFGIGSIFYFHVHRLIGLIFYTLALITLFSGLFNFDIAGVLFAFLFIYLGYKLFTGNLKLSWLTKPSVTPKEEQHSQEPASEHSGLQASFQQQAANIKAPTVQHSLIGEVRFINQQFELQDMNISYTIGDVKIDLSKAIIPEGESVLAISGIIGDVDIYVPHDLDVSVTSSVTLGNFDILGYKQNGVNRQIQLATKGYHESHRKVKISVSLFIGDVDVRFL